MEKKEPETSSSNQGLGRTEYRTERSTSEPKDVDAHPPPGRGGQCTIPGKNAFHINGNPKDGDTGKNPPRGMPPKWEPLPSRGSPPFPGTEQAVPGRAPSHALRSLCSMAAPALSPGRLGLLLARPRGVWWRSREPVPRGAY